MKKSTLAIPFFFLFFYLSAQDVLYYMEDFAAGPNGWTVNTSLCEGTTGDLIGTYSLISATYDGQAVEGLNAELSIYTILEYTLSFEQGENAGYSQGQFTVENGAFLSSLTGADFDLSGTIDSLEDNGRLLFSSQLDVSQEIFDQWGLTLTGAGGPGFDKTGNNVTMTSSDGLSVLNFEKTGDCGQVWIWHPDGQIGYGDLFPPPGMGMISQSNNNGVMSLNADWLNTRGDFDNIEGLPAFESELISPSIDLSDVNEPVFLRFNQALAYFLNSGAANAPVDEDGLDIVTSVSYSIDGGQSWIDSIDVNADVKYTTGRDLNFVGTNFNFFPVFTRLIEIPNIAGQSDVRIKFNWAGTFYFWAIDDVSLQSKPENDLALGDFVFFPPASYEQPAQVMSLDTMAFLANVSNLGVKDAANARLRVFILGPDGDLIHEDSLFIDALPMEYEDSLFVIEDLYVPDEITSLNDEYTIIYTTASDSTDANLSNNYKILRFRLSDNLYSKDDNDALFGTRFQNDFRIGCYYELDPSLALAGIDSVLALSAIYSAFASASQPLSSSPNITTLLYEVKETVRDDFLDFDFASNGDEDDLEVIAFGTSTFPSDTGSVDEREVPIGDIDGNPPLLKAGGRYFLVNNYEGSANRILHQYDRDIRYYQRAALVFSDGRWFFGFGSDSEDSPRNAPIMRMKVAIQPMVVSTDHIPLPENALNIYPNPVVEQLNAEVDLERNGRGVVLIVDAKGQIMMWRKYDALQKENLRFNVKRYPPGQYFIRLGTEEGTRTLPFVVAK